MNDGVTQLAGVSFVIPVHNGRRWIADAIAAIGAATYDGPIEIVVVDDRSTDGSREWLAERAAAGTLRLIDGGGRGAAAAINAGVRAAAHPLIAQIDQDVVIGPRWLTELVRALDDAGVAAAQGHYVAAASADVWARLMGLDLRQRYRRLGAWTDHACTGNSIYRKSALEAVGGFDESLGYGYDNDMSYRLTAAGYRLAFRAEAESTHHWREGAIGYASQQYGFGYGRLDLVAKHRRRVLGDDVAPPAMMLHAPLLAAAIVAGAVAIGCLAVGVSPRVPVAIAAGLIVVLIVERAVAGLRAAVAFRDRAAWALPIAHLLRDAAWVAAIVVWIFRRAFFRPVRPSDSMRPRN
jgi:hypothetical protein